MATLAAIGGLTALVGAAPAGASTGGGNSGGPKGLELVVNTTADTTDASPDDGRCADAAGRCSLRAAVQTAGGRAGMVSIVLRHDRYPLTIAGPDEESSATGDLDVRGQLRIDGRGATIDLASLGDRGFDVMAGGSLSVRDARVEGGRPVATQSGGAFRSAGTLRMEKVQAVGNVVVGAGASGGAILNAGGDLTVVDSFLADNTATRAGGGIEAVGGATVVDNTVMARNRTGDAPGNGGALHLTGSGRVSVDRSLVSGNVASAEGGGLWNSATGTMTVSRSEVSDNAANGAAADNGGGAIFNDGGSLSVTLTAMQRNTAGVGSGSGGAIFNNAGRLEVTRSALLANSSRRAGGGIETLNGEVVVDRSELARNTTGPAPGNGGALHVSGDAGTVTVSRSAVTDNSAAREGGGLWAGAGRSTMTVELTDVSRNVALGAAADDGGGGLFNDGGALTIDRSAIRDNRAPTASGSGGGVLNRGTLTVSRTQITGNAAARAGGGVETIGGTTRLSGVELRDNATGSAPGNGGGFHTTGAGDVAIVDSQVTGNRAANEGGGLWNSATGTMVVQRTAVRANTAPLGADLFQQPGAPANGLVVDGRVVAPGGGA